MKNAICLLLGLVAGGLAAADVDVSFARAKWNRADFFVAKSFRFERIGLFDQLDDAIVNRCPDGMSGKAIFDNHQKLDAVYSALVHRQKLTFGCEISSTMSFDYRMAPIIVLCNDFADTAAGIPEFREHWEVCLYDEGINVWHHYFEDGRQKWYKAAAILVPEEEKFAPNARHELKVRVVRNARGIPELNVSCGKFRFSYAEPKLPKEFQAGIIGCEGRNFFYDFKIHNSK